MNIVSLISACVSDAVRGMTDTPLEVRMEAGMRAACHAWIGGSLEERLQGALSGVYTHASPEEQARILQEVEIIKAFDRLLEGCIPCPEDAERMETHKTIGVAKLWARIIQEEGLR